jgi:hypothetical protein
MSNFALDSPWRETIVDKWAFDAARRAPFFVLLLAHSLSEPSSPIEARGRKTNARAHGDVNFRTTCDIHFTVTARVDRYQKQNKHL